MGVLEASGGRPERADSALAIVSHRRSTRQQRTLCREGRPTGRLEEPTRAGGRPEAVVTVRSVDGSARLSPGPSEGVPSWMSVEKPLRCSGMTC